MMRKFMFALYCSYIIFRSCDCFSYSKVANALNLCGRVAGTALTCSASITVNTDEEDPQLAKLITACIPSDSAKYPSGTILKGIWHQSTRQIYVLYPIPKESVTRNLKVDFTKKVVEVSVNGIPLLSFDCLETIDPHESVWTSESSDSSDFNYLLLDITKSKNGIWSSLESSGIDFNLLEGTQAKETVQKLIANIHFDQENLMLINSWLSKYLQVKCYILQQNGVPKSFALLKKMDFDPLGVHSSPYMLEYIYTFEDSRKKTLAYQLLVHMQNQREQVSALYTSSSANLFRKARFRFIDEDDESDIGLPICCYP